MAYPLPGPFPNESVAIAKIKPENVTLEREKDDRTVLMLSLGGSMRRSDPRSELEGKNTAADLVNAVLRVDSKGRMLARSDYNVFTLVVISSEDMEEETIKKSTPFDEGWYDIDKVFVKVMIPSIREDPVLPLATTRDTLAARNAFIVSNTINSLAATGESTANGPFMQAFANLVKSYTLIFVHNDLWHGTGHGRINMFLEQTPCILYALKQAVDSGTTVVFVSLGDNDMYYEGGPHYNGRYNTVVWEKDKDLQLKRGVYGGKRRSKKKRYAKINALPVRSRTRRTVLSPRLLGI
jgi:hypothetical protein